MTNLFAIITTILIACSPHHTAADIVSHIDEKYPTWETEYQLGVFDCSEMAAYVSDCLTANGIPNQLVVGHRQGSAYYHAWVVTDNAVIECTTLDILPRTAYDNYELSSKDYFAPSEWDWWNSPLFKGAIN